jgi:hypothetical protein
LLDSLDLYLAVAAELPERADVHDYMDLLNRAVGSDRPGMERAVVVEVVGDILDIHCTGFVERGTGLASGAAG